MSARAEAPKRVAALGEQIVLWPLHALMFVLALFALVVDLFWSVAANRTLSQQLNKVEAQTRAQYDIETFSRPSLLPRRYLAWAGGQVWYGLSGKGKFAPLGIFH